VAQVSASNGADDVWRLLWSRFLLSTAQARDQIVLTAWRIPFCLSGHLDLTRLDSFSIADVDAKSVCLELMLQPLPSLIPIFEGPCSPCLSSLSLVFQVFSWIMRLPTVVLASECVLHPFLWHDLTIVIFFLGSPSRETFVLFFSVSPHLWLSLQVIPRMPLWWVASSFLLNVTVRGLKSAL